MFFGAPRTVSSIQTAGSPGAGARAPPKALVVLVKMKAETPPRTASSSRARVPVMLVSTKSCRLWVPT